MLHVVTQHTFNDHHDWMEQAFRLRHRVFVDEKGWEDLRSGDGREIDPFDDEHAVHMLIVVDERVIGYQRMLPTTRPHLLSDVMPQLCEGLRPAAPNVWEWTRYCVEPAHRERGRALSPVANVLLSGIVEWGLASSIDTILIEMSPIWLLRLVQLHFLVTPLGIPRPIGGEEVVAVAARFDRRTLERLRCLRSPSPLLGEIGGPVIASNQL